ncbi:MAG: AAA family ATPase [Deltaproteobacteria bacterium]|nr:AAA family ATPase [Deltaproteobacteria bacterium]
MVKFRETPAVRIDPQTGWAWCGDRRLDLAPKAFAVLRHLVDRPLHLVTKDDLFTAGWSDTVVSEATLTSCIRDLRKALGDSSRAPRYIETVHRRGFRFVGPVATAAPAKPTVGARTPSPLEAPTLVGRDDDLAALRAHYATASAGRRRIVFVTGEAGIGKTSLVEAFLAELATYAVRIGRGQCLEHHGASEPYLPILEAFGRMGREPRGMNREPERDDLVRVLTRYAPTWLAQLPALLGDDDLATVQRRTQGTTRERMLRELAEAFDALGAETPFVLLLEDLHWSDVETIDLLAMLARRRDPARLLILATYRAGEVAADAHPLKFFAEDLRVHGAGDEVALAFLDAAAVGEYLDRRYPGAAFPPELAPALHANTGGNPLFLVNVVDELAAQGHIGVADGRTTLTVPVQRIASEVPHSLRQMVERQIDRLSVREQTVLAVASVAGAEFSAAITTADGVEAGDGERCCEDLARRGRFLRAAGVAEWPDGTVAGRYAFIHALYRSVLSARIPAGHRVGLHLRVGDRLERAHGTRAHEIAGELARHFEAGRDFERAAHYRRLAAEAALRQHGYREAVHHGNHALELLAALPESPARARDELLVQNLLGAASIATSGWAAPEVARAYRRARELSATTGVTPELFPVLLGLCAFYLMRGELDVADEWSGQLLTLAETTDDAAALLGAHNTAGMVAMYRGDYAGAVRHVERSKAIYDPKRHAPNRHDGFTIDHDPGVSCAAHEALALLVLGHIGRATVRMRECLAGADGLDHPLSVAMAYNFAAIFYQLLRDAAVVRKLEDVRLAYSQRHDFDLFLMLGEIYRGWLLAEDGRGDEGAELILHGLAVYQAVGAELGRPTFLGIFADVCNRLGRRDEARTAITAAFELGERTGLRYWDAELHRLRGTIALADANGGDDNGPGAAERCFREALAIAERQQARLLALRAATDLARLWRDQGRRREARTLLAESLAALPDGQDVADVRDARALLTEVGARRSTAKPAVD